MIRRLCPVISSGWVKPIASRIVGATSPRTPSVFFRLQPLGALAMMNGTLLVVCEVFGFPSGNFISSALLNVVSDAPYHQFNTELTRDLK